ncbi:hypothetical protein CEXT_48321 [Caerostris extrusa]|uniref:Uncharacterized protein n=1 Tax=Caerostris extrusa TaxID=172846 RepID=A0AAV4N240_CAEEX|nr:hypothetical protein CEXT_48321 [Caerostris extrusa]
MAWKILFVFTVKSVHQKVVSIPGTVIIHIILGYVADSGQPKISAWILQFMKVYDTLHYLVSLKFGRTPPGTVPGVYFLMSSGFRVRNQDQQAIEKQVHAYEGI